MVNQSEIQQEIIKVTPYNTFELKGRGIVFDITVEDNEHLVGVKLINKKFVYLGDTYIIREIEKIRTGDEVEPRTPYGLLTDKIESLSSK